MTRLPWRELQGKPRNTLKKERKENSIPKPRSGVTWAGLCRNLGTHSKNWGLGRRTWTRETKVGGIPPRGRQHAFCPIGGSAQTFLYGVTGYLPVGRPRLRDVTPR